MDAQDFRKKSDAELVTLNRRRAKKATERSLRFGRDDARQWRVASEKRQSVYRRKIWLRGLKPLTCLRGYVGPEAPAS
jgi:hypothetical protein